MTKLVWWHLPIFVVENWLNLLDGAYKKLKRNFRLSTDFHWKSPSKTDHFLEKLSNYWKCLRIQRFFTVCHKELQFCIAWEFTFFYDFISLLNILPLIFKYLPTHSWRSWSSALLISSAWKWYHSWLWLYSSHLSMNLNLQTSTVKHFTDTNLFNCFFTPFQMGKKTQFKVTRRC